MGHGRFSRVRVEICYTGEDDELVKTDISKHDVKFDPDLEHELHDIYRKLDVQLPGDEKPVRQTDAERRLLNRVTKAMSACAPLLELPSVDIEQRTRVVRDGTGVRRAGVTPKAAGKRVSRRPKKTHLGGADHGKFHTEVLALGPHVPFATAEIRGKGLWVTLNSDTYAYKRFIVESKESAVADYVCRCFEAIAFAALAMSQKGGVDESLFDEFQQVVHRSTEALMKRGSWNTRPSRGEAR